MPKSKISYEDCLKIARQRGGRIISSKSKFNYLKSKYKFRPSRVPLEWKCGIKEHNPWTTTYNSIQQNTWCPECAGNCLPKTYEDCQKIAEERGGKLLTSRNDFKELNKNQNPSQIMLKWKCENIKHNTWEAPHTRLQQGSWCPDCAGNRPKTYEKIKDIAEFRGKEENGIAGKLLTTKDKFEELKKKKSPSQIILKWKCGIKNHKPWNTTYDSVLRGHWCPYCSEGKSEEICRWFFEQIFKKKFSKISLSKIIPKYSGRMHLDGYAEIQIMKKIFRLGFEYNGIQHYKFPNFFHKNYQEFLRQIQTDKVKKTLCENNKILLIIVPYKVIYNQMLDFIIKAFERISNIKLFNIPKYNYRFRNIQSAGLESFF